MAEYLGMSDKVSEMMAEQEFAAAGKVLKREAALLEVCTVCVPHDAEVQDAYNTSKRFLKTVDVTSEQDIVYHSHLLVLKQHVRQVMPCLMAVPLAKVCTHTIMPFIS